MVNKFTGKKEHIEYEDGTRIELAEDDSPALSDKEFDALAWKRGIAGLPKPLQNALKRTRGRPIAENPKQQVTMRLDADLLAFLRATGKGWQSRANEALREWAGV